jgi:Ni2+-binding GTPase involved in maturation of urease and hydrogenase
MTARPIVVSGGSQPLRELMATGHVHHLPVVEGDHVTGVWLATEEGPLVMLGPERVYETTPEADAAEAIAALVDDAEVVVVWDSGVPAGVLTRTDVLALVRTALGRGMGRRHPQPVVVRITGPAGAGKTTLLARTLALLPALDVGVVQANASAGAEGIEWAGARAIDAPDAHWRSGLARAIERLSDTQLILVEDRDGPLEQSRDIGEHLQVVVVPAAALAELAPELLDETAAVVACRADEVDAASLDFAVTEFRERCPGLPVFALAPCHDDRGLAEWARWLEGEVHRRRA